MSLGRKTTFILVLQVMGAGLGYASALLIGRYFPPGGYGQFLFALSALGFVAFLTSLGLGDAHVHFVARGVPRERALAVYARLRLGLTLALGVIGLGLVWWLAGSSRLADATTVPILAAALAIQVLGTLRQVPFDTWVGQERVNRPETAKLVENVAVVALLAGVGLAIAASQGRWTPVPGVAAWLADVLAMPPGGPDIATTGLLLAFVYLCAKGASGLLAFGWWLRERPHVAAWDGALARDYMRYALPVALTSATVLVMSYTDIVMLGFFHTSVEVGHYGMAQRLAGLALIASTALGTLLLPRFSALQRAGEHAEAAATMADAERHLLLLTMPLAAALVAIPAAILHIAVGDAYLEAAGALVFLAPWAVAIAAATPGRTRLLGAGQGKAILRSGVLAAALNVVLNLVLVPEQALGLGAQGAALGSFAATLAGAVYLRLQLRQHFGTRFFDPALPRLVLAGAGAVGFWSLAWAWAGPGAFDRAWELAAWLLAGLAAYAGLAWLLRVLRPEDLRRLGELASPRAMWGEMWGRR